MASAINSTQYAATPSTPPAAPDTGLALQASFEPTNNAAGGIYKIIDKDTGRVVVELPFPLVANQGSGNNEAAAPRLDLTA
ncbi:MAG: hypothetical protein P4L64_08525 [Caulobacteraceae bacterium]|nr:hypothetical protein [Caulobacteraceae bacterium]